MEKEFVDWLERNRRTEADLVSLGLGDDAAVIDWPASGLVVSTDTISDGTHFQVEHHDLEWIGHKAISVSLSDLAAMGAQPVFALVNFTCPAHFELDQLKRLFDGMWQTAHEFGVAIVGGDTNRWDGRLVIGSTVFGGKTASAVSDFWKMENGKPGDQVFVSGQLGGSILGKHIEFKPQVALARALANTYHIDAATDITDSLALDLFSLARKSNCGFRIEADAIPVANAARQLEKTSGQNAIEHALYDGEDFELILCVSNTIANDILTDQRLSQQLTRIGELTEQREFLIRWAPDENWKTLPIKGFEH